MFMYITAVLDAHQTILQSLSIRALVLLIAENKLKKLNRKMSNRNTSEIHVRWLTSNS